MRKLTTTEEVLVNLLQVNFAKGGIYGLDFTNEEVEQALDDSREYQNTDLEYLEALPYDYQSPLGVFRGVYEMLMATHLTEEEAMSDEAASVWHDLANQFSGQKKEIAHVIN